MIKSILIAAILCSSAAFAQNAAEKGEGPVGRYQFVCASIVTQEGKKQETLFKVDTVTGKTWRYMAAEFQIPESKRRYPNMQSSGVEGWLLIEEWPNAFDKAVKESEKK